MEHGEGFEPPKNGFADHRLNHLGYPHSYIKLIIFTIQTIQVLNKIQLNKFYNNAF